MPGILQLSQQHNLHKVLLQRHGHAHQPVTVTPTIIGATLCLII